MIPQAEIIYFFQLVPPRPVLEKRRLLYQLIVMLVTAIMASEIKETNIKARLLMMAKLILNWPMERLWSSNPLLLVAVFGCFLSSWLLSGCHLHSYVTLAA